MNKFKNKLRSRAGASMILAMVFMLFCSFVGSSVLASATANAQRVAQLAEQQDFMLQRSAALAMADQLRLDAGQSLRMTVVDQKREIQGIIVDERGNMIRPVEGKFKKDRVITFEVYSTGTLTPMQQLMLESTVWRYLREIADDLESGVELVVGLNGFPGISNAPMKNFPTNNAIDWTQFLFPYPTDEAYKENGIISGELKATTQITSAEDASNPPPDIPEYQVRFSMGKGLYLYDFFVDLGEDSQVKMTMNAYSGVGIPVNLPTITRNDAFFGAECPDVQITSESTTTTISWQNPLVEKGGAQ